MNRIASLVALAALSSGVACSGCTPEVGAVKSGSISGTVIKGPVSNATVTAYAVDASGRRTDELGTAKTDDVGAFTVDVAGHAGPALVCASGGIYAEESTGSLVQVGPSELCRLVDGFTLGEKAEGLLLTPWTTLHSELASCFSDLGREATLEGASQRAALRLNDFLSAGIAGYDFATTIPADVTTATGLSLSPEAWAGILLAGVSESATAISVANAVAPGVRFTGMSLTDSLKQDIAGGCVFDGIGVSGVSLTQGVVGLSADTLRGAPNGLAQSIGAFLRGARNTSGINEATVADLTRALGAHTSEIFGGGGVGDLDAPTVNIVEPAAGFVSGSPTITVEASDANTIATLAFTAPDFLVGTGEMVCTTPNACTLTATLNTTLIDGSATITVEAVDAAGNRGEDSVVVTVNNTAPVITISAPGDDDRAVDDLLVAAQVSDPDGISSFTLDIPGIVVTANCAPPVLTKNCDSDPDPNKINVLWNTRDSNEGLTELSFVATDTAGLSQFASVTVNVDNLAAGVINGRVDLGTPVTGGSVSVFALEADGSRGRLLGTDSDIQDGQYQVEDPTSNVGPMVVVATGGQFIDVSTGVSLFVNAGQELLAAVSAGRPGEAVTANINAWTTLAARRALTHVGDSDSLADAITENTRLFELFFRRPSPDLPLPLLTTVSANLTDEVRDSESSDQALLALTHAGLSRLAADTSIATGQNVGAINLVDVVNAMGLDVSDAAGLFDGRAGNAALFLDPGSDFALDSFTPRSRLAIAIFAFASNADISGVTQPRNKSGIEASSIAQQNRLLDDISLYDDVRLFPSDQPPQPFDRDPPEISFDFLAPHQEAALGDELSGLVNLFGGAIDVSDIVRFEVVAPDELVGVDLIDDVDSLQLAIGTDIPPNLEDVALTCGLVPGDPPLEFDLDRQVCVCAEATDVAANTGVGVGCFARAPVRGGISPPPGTLLPISLPTFVFNATSGLDVVSCEARVVINGGLGGDFAFNGVEAGQGCSVSMNVVPDLQGSEALSPIRIDLLVEDAAGDTEFTFDYTFDSKKPTANVTFPATDGLSFRGAPTGQITAAVADQGSGVASATAVVRVGANAVIATLQGTITNGVATFPTFVDALPDAGERSIVVTVVDIAGNETTTTRTYVKDTTPPAFAFAASQRPYQPHASTNGVLSGNCDVFPFSTCTVSPPTVANRLVSPPAESQAAAPTYSRWAHLAGTTSASDPGPSLTIQTEPGASIRARTDLVCPADQTAFSTRPGAGVVSDTNGLAVIEIGDLPSLSSFFHRAQAGTQTLCLTYQVTDRAGNSSALATAFYKWNATTPAPLIRWNIAPFTGDQLADDVASKDEGGDDDVVDGTAQGASGRYFAHAYVIAPYSIPYEYQFQVAFGTAPTVKVNAQTERTISGVRATRWCYGNQNSELPNPANQPATDSAGSPIDIPSFSASSTTARTAGVKLMQVVNGLNLTTTTATRASTTFAPPEPTAMPPASASGTPTITTAAAFTITASLTGTVAEFWDVNSISGLPTSQQVADASSSFGRAGGTNGRVTMLLVRARVPNQSVALKRHFEIANTETMYNAECNGQAPTKNQNSFAVVQRLPASTTVTGGGAVDVVEPRELMLSSSGTFTICDGTSGEGDCRYGLQFTRYLGATFQFAAGTTVTPKGRLQSSNANATSFPSATVPSTASRTLTE